MSEWKVESLASHHLLGEFDCGEPSLSDWLKHLASQFVARDLAKVYVFVRHNDPRVWGYYSISTTQIHFTEFPPKYAKGLPQKMGILAALIGKLAMDKNLHGQTFGGVLLYDALARIRDFSATFGIPAVVVDAIDDRARGFYLDHQFIEFLDQPGRLFIPLSIVRRLPL